MIISDEKLEEFRNIYRKRYGKDISSQDAYKQAIKLVRMISAIYTPMTETEFLAILKRREELWLKRKICYDQDVDPL